MRDNIDFFSKAVPSAEGRFRCLGGARQIVSHVWRQAKTYYHPRVAILLYHSIAEAGIDPFSLHVTPDRFEEHLKVIKKDFRPLSLEQCLNQFQQSSLPSRGVVITFDDGYANNFTHALPLLEKYEIPATFFIMTGGIERKEEYWWDRLEQLFFFNENNSKEMLSSLESFKRDLEISTEGKKEKEHLFYVFWKVLRDLPKKEREGVLEQLSEAASLEIQLRSSHRPLMQQELLNLAASPYVTIGAHTVNHPNLAKADSMLQRSEIADCKIYLEKVLQRELTCFSYPYGFFGTETIDLVKEYGFRFAFAMGDRVISKRESRYHLPRIAVGNWSGERFRSTLTQKITSI